MDDHYDKHTELNEERMRPDEEEWPLKQRRPFIFKFTAAVVLVAFIALALGNVLPFFSLPPLDYIAESRRLSRDPLIRELQEAVVQIRVVTRAGNNAVLKGTGFNVQPDGLVVTNRHVIENAVSVTVLFPGRAAYKASGWFLAPTADLATVDLQGENLPVVSLDETLPEIGEKMTIIGNPSNFIKMVMQGDVINYRQVSELPEPLLEIDAPVRRGSSGSPVFNEDGRAAAVIFATVKDSEGGESRSLALPVVLLRDFWETL